MITTSISADSATPAQTREELLKRQARGYTQVRGVFVQRPKASPAEERASVLARFVHERKHHALVLYLLLLGAWPEIERRIANDYEPLEANVWVRALRSERIGALTWSPSTLSRAWGVLEEMKLVTRDRRGRRVHVTPRREDGLEDYTRPEGRRSLEHAYFVLPDAFWNDELFADLGLAALAMFLLIAKETNRRDEVHLTFPQFEEWYGIRQRTAQKGIKELRNENLLNVRSERVPAPLSGIGFTVAQHYSLTGEYGYQARVALRERAKSERDKRLKSTPAAGRSAKAAAGRAKSARSTTSRPGRNERERV